MEEIKVGIVGAGAISGSCARATAKHEKARVVAATDLNADRLAELCEAHDIPTAYATSAELFADPEIDVVYIAVPNKFHAPLALEALNAGKHVVLDKPFAMNLAEAEAVAEAAEKNGKTFFLGMNQRYRADSQKIAALVKQGVLGDIYHAKAFWFRRSGIPRLGTWFGNKSMAGGGCVLDIGVHLLDLCLFAIDNFEPVSVSGNVYTKFGNRGLGEGGWGKSDRDANITFDVDDFANARIVMANGASVTLDVSWACHAEDGNRNDVHIYGTEGGARLYPAKVFRNDPLRKEYDIIEEVNAPVKWPHEERFHNFYNALLGTEELGVTIEQALVVQKILDAIYESSATGREVRFD